MQSTSRSFMLWRDYNQPQKGDIMHTAKKHKSSTRGALLLLALAASLKSSDSCDVWNQTSGPIYSDVKAGETFLPLSGSVFASNNTGVPVLSASIFFSAMSNTSYFNDFGCPAPLTASSNGDLLVCTGSVITAESFTDASQQLITSLNTTLPFGGIAYGYTDYVSGIGCPVQKINDGDPVFAASRTFEPEPA